MGRRITYVGWLGLAFVLFATGCTTTKDEVVLTGNVMVDGPNAIAHGPPRDRVLWEYRTAAAAMRQGDYAMAKQYLDDALRSLGGIYGTDANAKKARSYFHGEAKKTFLGEPYERCMAYIYRGIIYWMDGEPDNARACFRSAQFEDGDPEKHEYSGDWVLAEYLDGFITTQMGGDGSDAFKRAQAMAKGIRLPPYDPKANVIFFVEFGPGPTKYATGEYGQELRFHVPVSPVVSAQLKVDALDIPIAATDNVYFQATSRGGRVMDHILGNKAVFKSTTDTAGNVALIGGLTTAAVSGNRTAQEVGLGVAAVGLVSKIVSAATVPAADTRSWDNLPHYLSFACLPLPPGQRVATVQFLSPAGSVVPSLTKTITLNITNTAREKVAFVSDSSITPQTL